jgi:hypothetical protein
MPVRIFRSGWIAALVVLAGGAATAAAAEPEAPPASRVGSEASAASPTDAGEARLGEGRETQAVRAAHRSRSGRSRVHTGVFFDFGPRVPIWWDPWWSHGWGLGYTRVYPAPGARYGALDTDVSPERAEVWVNGEKIGVADDFDGFPSYLWLEPGTYDVAFYLPGYETLARQYTIYPGLVIDVEDRLEKGESVHPRDLFSPRTQERRDARLRFERERREELERRQRGDELRSEGRALDARGEPGRVLLSASPGDASIYLDGRFLGTARELSRLRSGLLVDPGEHTLEVVRPGFRPLARSFVIVSGTELELDLELEEESGEAQPLS